MVIPYKNRYDKNLIPMRVKKPIINDKTFDEYNANMRVELKVMNGTKSHEKRGPSYPLMASI
jgi:hypothetical protein